MAFQLPTIPQAPVPAPNFGFTKAPTTPQSIFAPKAPIAPGPMDMVPTQSFPTTASKVDRTAPIPADKMGVSTPTFPAPIKTTTAATTLAAGNGAAALQAFNTQQSEAAALAAPPAKTDTNSRQSILDRIMKNSNALGDKAGRSYEIQDEEGVFQKKAAYKKLDTDIITKTRAYDAQIEAIRKNPTGKLADAVAADIANVERLKNSELADMRIQQKIASDDYVGAFEIAKAKIDSEFEPLQDEIKNLKDYYALSADNMTESEKMQAQAAIQAKEAEVQFGREKELARYKADIEQSSPLYKAQVANQYSQINERSTESNPEGTLNGKPQTNPQATANGYADRLIEAHRQLSGVDSKFASPISFGGALPNLIQSSDRQLFEQSKRNFVNAVLRRESGAVISPSEFLNADRQYFAQPGDGQAVLEQKRQNRETVINNFYREANVARPIAPGDILESDGVKYEVIDDEGNLKEV